MRIIAQCGWMAGKGCGYNPLFFGLVMPFTLAHPAAVLPLARSRLHFPALLLGSMAPDFVYFLAGRPVSGVGHSFWGCVLLNLPLVVLFYALYRWLVADVLWRFLPDVLRCAPWQGRALPRWQAVLCFVVSAFAGMASHVLLDAFTHKGAFFVEALPVLQLRAAGLPVYKWLQYGGGVFGMAAVALFWLWRARRFPAARCAVTARQKWVFWAACAVLALGGFALWWCVSPVSWREVAVLVIRAVDCGVLALLALCAGMRLAVRLAI